MAGDVLGVVDLGSDAWTGQYEDEDEYEDTGLALYQYPGIEGMAQGGAGRAGGGSEKLRRGEGWGRGLKRLG